MRHFERENLPGREFFRPYRKRSLTFAMRVAGEFTVDTLEGTVTCPDGWVAIDSEGWPYPIAATVFAATYEPYFFGTKTGD